MRDNSPPPISDTAKAFARALRPLGETIGDELDDEIKMEAPEVHEDLPPDEMAWRMAELLRSKDGRWGLFRRNSELIAWDNERKDFAEMTAKRFRTWLPMKRGVLFVKQRIPEKDENGKNTGNWIVRKGQLTKDKAECVLASDELRDALPEIKAFHPVRLPVFDGDTVRLLQVGYDEASGIYTHNGCPFDENLSFDEAANWLYTVFRTFGWRTENRDLAIHLAAMLSVFCRALYQGKAPAFAYVANIQSSGKTNLAWCGPWAIYGTRKTMPLLEDQDARLQETLNSLALAGVGYIILDNIDWGSHIVKTELLDQWISNAEWDFRKLNGNLMLAPKLSGVTFMTGNNITLSNDLARRSLICDLWNPLAAADRPRDPSMVLLDESFFGDEKNRSMMLACLWALVKEWDSNGRPQGSRELATFEVWSRVVPGIVRNAGAAFGRDWDCMAENTNENVGDKAARDYKRLAQLAMTEFGKDERGQLKDTFEVTVQQLAGISRRHTIEECQFALYPEKDLESALKCLHPDKEIEFVPGVDGAPGIWRMSKDDFFDDPAKASGCVKQAAEYLTPTSRSKFGNAVKDQLNDRYFKASDDALYHWQQRKGVTPARYAVTRVKPKA